jgi:type IV secretory pathway VirB3-like protein
MRTNRIITGATRPAMFAGVPLIIAVLTGLGVFLILMLINVPLARAAGPRAGYLSVPVIVFVIGFFMWARRISKVDSWELLQRIKKSRQRRHVSSRHLKRWRGVSYAPSQVIDWSKK